MLPTLVNANLRIDAFSCMCRANAGVGGVLLQMNKVAADLGNYNAHEKVGLSVCVCVCVSTSTEVRFQRAGPAGFDGLLLLCQRSGSVVARF